MAHCNDKNCTASSRYDDTLRVCQCSCDICGTNTVDVRPRGARGTCESCGAQVGPSDEFCDGCGTAVSDMARAGAIGRANDEMWERNQSAATTATKVSKASRMIGWLAVLFSVSGIVMWRLQHDIARRGLQNLVDYASNDMITLEQKQYRVSDLRAHLEAEPKQLLAINLALAAIMVGLYIWSRRSPLPAIATALAVFVGVTFISFLAEPASLLQGIVIKIVAIGALVTGLRSALAARTVDQRVVE